MPPGMPCTVPASTSGRRSCARPRTSRSKNCDWPGRKSTSPRGATGSGGTATIIPARRTHCSTTCSASICKTSTPARRSAACRPRPADQAGRPPGDPHAATLLSGGEGRRPAQVFRLARRRPLRVPERARDHEHGHAWADQGDSFRLQRPKALLIRMDFQDRAMITLVAVRCAARRLRRAHGVRSSGEVARQAGTDGLPAPKRRERPGGYRNGHRANCRAVDPPGGPRPRGGTTGAVLCRAARGRSGRDRAPREGSINLTCPLPDFEQAMWDV